MFDPTMTLYIRNEELCKSSILDFAVVMQFSKTHFEIKLTVKEIYSSIEY